MSPFFSKVNLAGNVWPYKSTPVILDGVAEGFSNGEFGARFIRMFVLTADSVGSG